MARKVWIQGCEACRPWSSCRRRARARSRSRDSDLGSVCPGQRQRCVASSCGANLSRRGSAAGARSAKRQRISLAPLTPALGGGRPDHRGGLRRLATPRWPIGTSLAPAWYASRPRRGHGDVNFAACGHAHSRGALGAEFAAGMKDRSRRKEPLDRCLRASFKTVPARRARSCSLPANAFPRAMVDTSARRPGSAVPTGLNTLEQRVIAATYRAYRDVGDTWLDRLQGTCRNRRFWAALHHIERVIGLDIRRIRPAGHRALLIYERLLGLVRDLILSTLGIDGTCDDANREQNQNNSQLHLTHAIHPFIVRSGKEALVEMRAPTAHNELLTFCGFQIQRIEN